MSAAEALVTLACRDGFHDRCTSLSCACQHHARARVPVLVALPDDEWGPVDPAVLPRDGEDEAEYVARMLSGVLREIRDRLGVPERSREVLSPYFAGVLLRYAVEKRAAS